MENALETTFKNMQSDERYKKLARTLKMALIKNAERRSSDSGNTGTWPNVSSINGDHMDTSLAAMSVQSSRVGSEVVSSSANLRNILLHKQHFNGPRNNVATSSENQFPTSKDNDDSAMMPPPRTPGIGVNKRFSRENQRVPLLNMPVNSGRNTNGFSMSTPASSISSIPKCTGSISVNSSTVFQENNNYGRNGYEESVLNSAQKQERNFARWRVLLNDKAQLIIKGTLECGKIARSKPVIRRLSPTSVQSVFKHTYHLQGNLVDDRGELPDYVRGKFYNGFPDDWENVYQVWRNFVNDGSRLSFHWPTAVTDSDDDIKSGITEITYRPERYKKSASPRKRSRSARSSKLDLSAENTENRSDSRNATSGVSPENSDAENHPSPRKSLRSHSKNTRQENPRKADAPLEEKQKSHESTTTSLDSKNSSTSLAGYIPEDKINIIIDNLTNKNCPIEYIQKIVQMFDCMKYLASYPSLENESENGAAIPNENEAPKTPINVEGKNDGANTSNTKTRVNTPRPSIPKINQHANQFPASKSDSLSNEKSYKDSGRQTRRQLISHDYESSETEDDSCDDTRKTLPHKFSASERVRKTQKYKNPPETLPSRQYVAPEKIPKYQEIPVARKQSHDSSISDEEFIVERIREPKMSESKTFLSPRKIGPGKENRRIVNHYDSSISITEDEERYTEKPKIKETRKDNYDSSISITEDEHPEVRTRSSAKNYYSEKNARPLEPEMRRNGNSRDDRKRNDANFPPGIKSRSTEQNANRNGDNRGRKRLDSLDYYSDENSRRAEQNVSRNGNTREDRKKDSLDYYPEENSRRAEQNVSRNGNTREDRKKDSLDYYPEENSRRAEQNVSRNGNTREDRKKDSLDYYSDENSRRAEQNGSRTGNTREDRKKDSLDYYPDENSRRAEQNVSRTGNTREDRKKDSLDYYPEENSRHAEQNGSRNGDIRDGRKRQDSSDYYSNSHSNLSEQDLRRSGDISEDRKRQESLKYHVESPLKLQGTSVSKNLSHLVNEEQHESALLVSEAKRSKKLISNSESSKTYQQEFPSPESPEIPLKTKTPQVRNKPIIVSTETVKLNLTAHDWQEINCRKEIDKTVGNSPRKFVDGQKGNPNFNAVKNDSIPQKNSDLAESAKMPEIAKPNTRSREANVALRGQESRSFAADKKYEKIEDSKDSEKDKPAAEYGSQENPKLLTAWVPAVICDDDGDKNCHLIFEGKLLNEAGHVANRKFVTDVIRRRLSPRIIETVSHEFYKLVGDLNDTKRVVPKELIKLCHNGCPGKIGNFCERWKSLTGEIYKSPPHEPTDNTSVDCLGVPMSSRGRRILPPLNYWAGERVATKDNKTVYSPGNSQEGSITSSLENSNQDVRNKKNSPKARPETKRTNESKVSETKKKDVVKISPPNKSAESPPQPRESKKTRAAKRRLAKNVQISSSESDDAAETKPTPRKRKTNVNDKVVNSDNVPTRKLRNSVKNPSSPQTIEDASPQKGSFDKSSDPEVKLKNRKRQKMDENQGTMQRFLTKKPPEIKCTFYKNVPLHDGDLSEDQLSTM